MDLRPLHLQNRALSLAGIGLAAAALGLLQALSWNDAGPVPSLDYQTPALTVLLFAIALGWTTSRSHLVLLIAAILQLWFAVKTGFALEDLHRGWGAQVPFHEYARHYSTPHSVVSLGTAFAGLLFAFLSLIWESKHLAAPSHGDLSD